MLIMDAILLGGGLGTRFSKHSPAGEIPKQFQFLGAAPVFIHGLRAFVAMQCFRQIVLTFPRQYLDLAREHIETFIPPEYRQNINVVEGGERRQDSTFHALEAIEASGALPSRILIHDACRPYLAPEFLSRVHDRLLDRSYGAWVPVVPVVETLKRVENSQVIETVDRSAFQRVQTPQIFEYTVIRPLVEKVRENPELNFTDDASLCEHYGIPVGTFPGDVRNIKLTYDFELETLRLMMEQHKAEERVSCEQVSDTTFTV